jgi:hypothetical protein
MAKKEKEKFKKDNNDRLKIPILAVSDNIVFSKKEVWAYYKISTVPFDFLSLDSKADLAERTVNALGALSASEGKKVDGHILITNTPLDVMSWVNQMDKAYTEWHPNQVFPDVYNKFIDEESEELTAQGFQRPIVYLGIRLFNRGSFDLDNFNVLEFGFHDAWKLIKEGISNMFVLQDDQIDEFEDKRAHDAEAEIFRTLSTGNLNAKRVTSNEMLLTIKRRFYPSMPVPYLEVDHGTRFGTNDIVMETGGVIENNYRYLEFNQMIDGEEYEGYRATMSFARFPKDLSMPGNHSPFLYMPASQGLPYTMSARFTMIPQTKVKKDLQKKKLDTDDEINNLAGSGQASNAHIEGTVRDLQELEDSLENNKLPWVSGAYRVTIEAPTVEMLKSMASQLKQDYADNDTNIIWTSGDQLKLFLEELPGGTLSSPSFNQMTNLAMLGVSGFNIGGNVGDPINEKLILTERGDTDDAG